MPRSSYDMAVAMNATLPPDSCNQCHVTTSTQTSPVDSPTKNGLHAEIKRQNPSLQNTLYRKRGFLQLILATVLLPACGRK
eukprot:3074192-Rhodomonas_salina.1